MRTQRYAVARRKGRSSGVGGVHDGSSGKGRCSAVLTVTFFIILAWLGFLLYCWRSGRLLQTAKLPMPASISPISGILNRVDHSLRGAASSVAPVAATLPVATILIDAAKTVAAAAAIALPSTPQATKAVQKKTHDIHIVFSTDCTPYQDYQTIVLFHSARTVGQNGPVTRIASGCDEQKKKQLTALYLQLYPEYHVHFTPDFKKDGKTGHSYDFYNKPWGMKHWLEHADPPVPAGMVIALLDPDMILVRPLTPQVRGQPNNVYNKHVYKSEADIIERIVEGKPVAQMYGLGAPWTNDQHKRFNRTYICGADSPCLEPMSYFGEQHYAVGPPYMAVKEDMVRIAATWTKFVPRVYEHYPFLLAEMYAYSMAAAHERLPHLQLENLMVSNTDAGGEGWPLVDKLPHACSLPVDGIYLPGTPLPTVVHYCQNFRAGNLGFAKRQVHKGPDGIFSCAHPLFVEPSVNLDQADFRIKAGEKQDMSKKSIQIKRNAYTLCVIHRSINAAMIDYKQRMCQGVNDTSYEKTYIAVPAH